MKDIAVIIPVHELNDDTERMLLNAIDNIKNCQKWYDDKLIPYVVTPLVMKKNITDECKLLLNSGKTDFCSQINFAVENITEDYFSILEFDDEYTEKWFSMAKKYFYTNEDVSVFLPINIQMFENEIYRQFGNESPWAMEFSSELGFIDFNSLKNFYSFNLTGGIFNKNDFIKIGGLKPSMEVSFNYEFLLRLTNKGLKAFVVPKEGYKHLIGRKDSLTDICSKKYPQEEIDKWYAIAQKEYQYSEDRPIN